MFKKPQLQLLRKRMDEPRRFIQVLMGPRQVGKTTMAGQLVKKIKIPTMFESADGIPAGNVFWIEQVWDAVRLKMKMQREKEFLLVLDEIQKISNWSEIVKKLWDEDTRNGVNIKVLILGSSRLLFQQGLSETLAGRFETMYLGHWSYSEMKDAFGWDAHTFAWFGGYPGSSGLIKDEDRWKQYIRHSLIETSVSNDILMHTRIDKPALLKNLFDLGCLYSGEIVSYTKIMGQLQDAGNTVTLAHYLNLLDTAGLLGGVNKFSADIIRKRASSPKFQVHNNALLSAQHNESFSTITNNPDAWEKIVKSSIGSHLLNQSYNSDFKVYYWREGSREVDFVLEHKGKLVAIDIQSSFSSDKRGMEAFKKKFNPDRIYFIDNKMLSWEEFLGVGVVDLF